jgi:hypothetical protein
MQQLGGRADRQISSTDSFSAMSPAEIEATQSQNAKNMIGNFTATAQG